MGYCEMKWSEALVQNEFNWQIVCGSLLHTNFSETRISLIMTQENHVFLMEVGSYNDIGIIAKFHSEY